MGVEMEAWAIGAVAFLVLFVVTAILCMVSGGSDNDD